LERNDGIPYTVIRVNGEPLRVLIHRDQNKSILHLFKQKGIVSPGESLDVEYFLWKWNYFSHPHGTHIEMMGEAIGLLHQVITLINRTWMRFLNADEMMRENVWKEAPAWVCQN